MPKIPFGVRTGNDDSRAVSGEMCLNCYVQIEKGAKDQWTVRGTPGIVTQVTLPTYPHRGHIEMGRDLYTVYGSRLYRITEADWATGSYTEDLGEVEGINRVIMAENGSQVAIAANGIGYIATSTSLVEITDENFRGPVDSVDEVDGYFVWATQNTDIWFLSNLNDGLAYDADDQAVAESETDRIVRVFSGPSEVRFFGKKTIEPWVNLGTSPFPFERSNQGIIPEGLYGRHTPVKLDNSFFWVNDDRIVQKFDQRPVRVSSSSVEALLEDVTEEEQLEAWGYTQDGHTFYVLTYGDEWTRVYDAASNEWHSRQFGPTTGQWRASGVANEPVKIFNEWVVGDPQSGKLGYLSTKVYTEWDEPIMTRCRSQNINKFPHTGLANRLSLDFEMGVGLMSGQGSDPQVMFRYSDDQANSWSRERLLPLGKAGAYNNTININGMPLIPSAGRTFEWTITDPVPRVFIKGSLDNGP